MNRHYLFFYLLRSYVGKNKMKYCLNAIAKSKIIFSHCGNKILTEALAEKWSYFKDKIFKFDSAKVRFCFQCVCIII